MAVTAPPPRIAAAAPARALTEEQARTGALPAGPGSALFVNDPHAPPLPRLRDALTDPTGVPVDAKQLPVPPEVLTTLRSAKRVLVIGHTATDGDAVGSVLGLSRALRLLGKQVDSVIDDELSGQLRSIPGSDQVARFGDRHR